MNYTTFRKICLGTLVTLLALVIVGVALSLSPRTPIAKDGEWVPYETRQQ